MSVRMVRAKIKADKATELEKAAKEMFTAIEAAQPQGVRYASCKLADGVTQGLGIVAWCPVDALVAVWAFGCRRHGFQDHVGVESHDRCGRPCLPCHHR